MLHPIKITKDQDYCGETLPDETYLIEVSGGLKNVVVFIESAPSGKQANPQKENFLYNDGCPCAPRVMAFQKGERLESRATIRSSTSARLSRRENRVQSFTAVQEPTIDATSKIRQAGIMKVVCDTYGWMVGYVHVFAHPSFAVTNEQGAFSIPDLSPGNYVLRVWHESRVRRLPQVPTL
jgi:hypothetical protein